MTQRLINGINQHKRLTELTYHKYDKRSPVGQLKAQYCVETVKPLLSVKLPLKAYIPHGRQVERKISGYIDRTDVYRPTKVRNRSAPVWVKTSDHGENKESYNYNTKPPSPRRVVFSSCSTKSAPSKRSNGSRGQSSGTKAVVYRIRPARMHSVLSKEDIHASTVLIKEQWDTSNRQYVKTGLYARGKPENKEKELFQWFSFEGEPPDPIEAFTKEVENTPNESVKYLVEANIGKKIAANLLPNKHIKIGNNGKPVRAETMPADEKSDFYVKCDKVIHAVRNTNQRSEPIYTPLSIKDIEKKSKVIVSKLSAENQTHSQNYNTSEPVVFNSKPLIGPYVHPEVKSDGEKLEELLRYKSIKSHEDPVEKLVTYEEVLESCAPISSQNTDEQTNKIRVAAPSPVGTKQTPDLLPFQPYQPAQTPKPQTAKSRTVDQMRERYGQQLHVGAPPGSRVASPRIKTPAIPDDIKKSLQRQCTVPNPKDIDVNQKINTTQATGRESDKRVATPVRPPKYIPSYQNGNNTSATISSNGVEGEREFIKITNPIKGLTSCPTPQYEHANNDMSGSEAIQTGRKQTAKGPEVPLLGPSETNVVIVGRTATIEPPRSAHVLNNSKVFMPSTNTDEHLHVNVESPLNVTEELPSPPRASRLDVNIPMADMASASSAAVNSIEDFQEFEMDEFKNVRDLFTPDDDQYYEMSELVPTV